jgi:hypothetical protein
VKGSVEFKYINFIVKDNTLTSMIIMPSSTPIPTPSVKINYCEFNKDSSITSIQRKFIDRTIGTLEIN